MALEEEFECEIPDEDAEKITTVQQADRLRQGARQGLITPPADQASAAMHGLPPGRPIRQHDRSRNALRP
jgi:hypothetical protein